MLKHIPKLLTGELLKILNDMGHGDTLVLADANFPRRRSGHEGGIYSRCRCRADDGCNTAPYAPWPVCWLPGKAYGGKPRRRLHSHHMGRFQGLGYKEQRPCYHWIHRPLPFLWGGKKGLCCGVHRRGAPLRLRDP